VVSGVGRVPGGLVPPVGARFLGEGTGQPFIGPHPGDQIILSIEGQGFIITAASMILDGGLGQAFQIGNRFPLLRFLRAVGATGRQEHDQ